ASHRRAAQWEGRARRRIADDCWRGRIAGISSRRGVIEHQLTFIARAHYEVSCRTNNPWRSGIADGDSKFALGAVAAVVDRRANDNGWSEREKTPRRRVQIY